MARILVTGSKGVIGSGLIPILEADGHHVWGIDLFHSKDKNYKRCDISEFRQLQTFFLTHAPFDFVYNCAAEFGRWNGEDYYEQVWKTNATGMKNLIRIQEDLRFKLIHFSSSEVYGDYGGLMTEDVMVNVPVKQMNDYAMSKWVNEMQIRNSIHQFDTESVIVRLFNTYGPGEEYHPYRSVNARFCHNALNGIKTTVYSGHTRTSTYLTDTCRTLANIVKNFIPGSIYNIGGDEQHTIEKLAEIIWDYTGADRDLLEYSWREPMTTQHKKVDVTKAKEELGHVQTVTLEEGVKKTIDWMKQNENLNSNSHD